MSVRTFYLGLLAAFGLPWVFLVAVPYGKLTASDVTMVDESIDQTYPQPNAGFKEYGNRIYASEGCFQCHSQMVRTTEVSVDPYRYESELGDPVRESRPADYTDESYAFLGVQRIGPDLANVGITKPRDIRAATGLDDVPPAIVRQWHMEHLFDPRLIHEWSNMPSYQHLFVKRRIQGPRSNNALNINVGEGYEIVPTERAEALVTYLMSLKKNDPTGPPKPEEPAEDDEA